ASPASTRITSAAGTRRSRRDTRGVIAIAPRGWNGYHTAIGLAPRERIMRHRVWLFANVGLFVLVGGLVVFLKALDAKPGKEDSGDPAARKSGAFDGDRALTYLATICEIGPRLSGSEGMTKQQDMLKQHFEKNGATVTLQKFDGKQPSREKAVPMANMIVSCHPKAERRVMICGPYDTRPIADQEPNFRDWTKPFASANDGTSTVAFMMELAHQMKDLKTEVGVDFVLFDAEEFIHDRNQ